MTPLDPDQNSRIETDTPPVFVIHAPRVASGAEGLFWITEGYRYFRQATGDWIAICVVGFMIMLGVNFIPMAGMVNGILGPVWIAGLMLGCKAQEEGQKLEIKTLFAGFGPKAGPLVICGLVLLLIQLVLGGIFIGSIILPVLLQPDGVDFSTLTETGNVILIIIKLLILLLLLLPVYAAAWFAPQLILFGNLPLKAALQMSLQACMTNVWSFLVYGLVMMLMVIVAVIPLGLGMLVAGPVIFVSMYLSFKAIFVD